MLENITLVTPFGKEDTAAELQSQAARTQDTLMDAVENAEVTEIRRAVFRALTRLRATEMKEFDTIADLKHRSSTRTTRPSDMKQCLMSSGLLLQASASPRRCCLVLCQSLDLKCNCGKLCTVSPLPCAKKLTVTTRSRRND